MGGAVSELNAEDVRVEVRAVDLYELVRHFYGTSRSARGMLAADRCNIALMGVPNLDQVLRLIDGPGSDWHDCDCGPVGGGWPHPASAHNAADAAPESMGE